MRILIADCSVDYTGRLSAHLPRAKRALIFKADGSVLVHSDGGSYKPLNWMSPPAKTRLILSAEDGETAANTRTTAQDCSSRDEIPEYKIEVRSTKTDDMLSISVFAEFESIETLLGEDPGLTKDGVEAHLQELLAKNPQVLIPGAALVRREYPTPIGPVDLLIRDENGLAYAVEVKRVGGIDGVEQLSRYIEMLGRDSKLAGVRGIFAAPVIKPQARVLAEDRGFLCAVLDYDELRGMDDPQGRLF